MSSSYRDNSLPTFKEEIEQLREEYLANQELEFQKELSKIKDQIKERVALGQSDFFYRVDKNHISSWLGFKAKIKPGTKTERLFNKFIELGFTPDIEVYQYYGELRIYF